MCLSLRLGAAGLWFLAMAGAASAADDVPELDAARRLLAAGQAQQAAALLDRDLLRFAGNPAYDQLLGDALYRAGEAGQALFAFERVMMAEPDNVAAYLTVARIYLEREEPAYAREVLALLADRPLDTEQRAEREQIRAAISAATVARGIALQGHVGIGVGWDDNVTSGPDQDTLLIPGLGADPTALGTAMRARDLVGTLELGLSLRKPLDADTWLTGNGIVRQGFNRSRKDVGEGLANIDFGVLRRNDRDYYGASLLAQDYLMDGSVYRKSLGLRLNWIRPQGDQSRLIGYAQYLDFDFPDHAIDNAARGVVGMMHEGAAEGGTRLWQYGVYGGKEQAHDPSKPQFSFRLLGAHLGGGMSVNDKLSLSLGAAYELRRHLSEDPLYFVMRRDATRSVGVAAEYKLAERWRLIARSTHTRNATNTPLYTYARNIFTLQLKWDFDNAKN